MLAVTIVFVHTVTICATTRLTRVLGVRCLHSHTVPFQLVLGVLLDFFEQPLLELGQIRDTLANPRQLLEGNVGGTNPKCFLLDRIGDVVGVLIVYSTPKVLRHRGTLFEYGHGREQDSRSFS